MLLVWAVTSAQADPRADAVQQARSGNFTVAIPALEQLSAAGDRDATADLIAVYGWAGRPTDALAAWSSLPVDQRPNWVKADAARALTDLGGGLGAQALLGATDPGINASAAASLARLTAVESPDPALRFAAADRALAVLDQALSTARAQPQPDAGLIRRLTFDRWIALRARVRMAEIVEEFSHWPEPPTAMPPYALSPVADALLYVERPEEARDLYREARRREPYDVELAFGLFYAEVECEDFAAAYALIDALDAEQPTTFKYNSEGAPRDNPDKLGFSVAAAQVRYYADEVAAAWPRFEKLALAAPGNTYVRREAAAIMAGRGWQRRALTELARVEALEPDVLATRLARTDLLFATRHYAEAEPEVAALAATYPENKAVQRLTRSWELFQSPEFYASYEHETGGGPDIAGGSWRASGEVWTPPIGLNWRFMAGYTAAAANIPEGDIAMKVPVVGLEWSHGPVDVLAQVGVLDSVEDATHARLRARWQVTDTWSTEISAAANTPDFPLRALYYLITGDTLAASVKWAPHESRQLTAGAQATDFSSGNRRNEGSASWRERLYERPHFDLDLIADTSLQTNSQLGEPYYAPDQSWDYGAGLEASHVIQRRYRTAWVHQAAVRVGQRAERGYDTGGIWSARYELRRNFSDAFSMTARITTGSNRYDGVPERFTRWELSAYGRF